MKTTIKVLIGTLAIFSALLTLNTAQADERKFNYRGTKIIKFDVAENGTRFVFDEAPVHEDTTPPLPAYGNPFITEGYIYPHGTIQCDDGGGVQVSTPMVRPNFLIRLSAAGPVAGGLSAMDC